MPESIFKQSRKNTFIFEGHAVITDNSFVINNTNTNGTWVYNSLNFGVDCGEHGINYVTMMGGYNPSGGSYISIQKLGEDGKPLPYENNIQVDWEDRLDFDVETEGINKAAFIDISVEKDANGKLIQKTFLSAYDAVEYLKTIIVDKFPVVVRGHIDYRLNGSGDWVASHVVDNISTKSEEFLQPKTALNLMVLVDKNTLGKPNIEEKNVPLYLNTAYYINKMNNNVYKQTCAVPLKILFDMNTIDLNNKEDKKRFSYGVEHYFSPSKEGFVNEVLFRCHYSGGVKKTEIKLEDLPSEIREGVESGFINKDQVLGTMAVQGPISKDIIFDQVMTRSKTVKTDEGAEYIIPEVIIEKEKYKDSEIVLFEDLEPVDSKNNTAPVDNNPVIEDEEIDKSAADIMALFSAMGN